MNRILVALVLILISLGCRAQVAMFYQPQLRDMQVADTSWPTLFKSTHDQGFDTVVLQWTRYGDAFSSKSDADWLRRRIVDARAQGLRVVLGLHADPDFFTAQYQSGKALETYFSQQRQLDVRLAKSWVASLGASNIAGWYVYAEIDDLRWQDLAARQILLNHLRLERQSLASIGPGSSAISSFFAGNSSPLAYHDLVMAVQNSGMRVWVQDGAGTGVLTPEARQQYVDLLSQCSYSPADGIVFEIYRQSSTGGNFTAERLSPAEEQAALAQRTGCGGASLFFEQRYLTSMADLLPL